MMWLIFSAWAQEEPIEFTVQIQNQDGDPISATIMIDDKRFSTDSDGVLLYFSDAGSTVEISAPGYLTQELSMVEFAKLRKIVLNVEIVDLKYFLSITRSMPP